MGERLGLRFFMLTADSTDGIDKRLFGVKECSVCSSLKTILVT